MLRVRKKRRTDLPLCPQSENPTALSRIAASGPQAWFQMSPPFTQLISPFYIHQLGRTAGLAVISHEKIREAPAQSAGGTNIAYDQGLRFEALDCLIQFQHGAEIKLKAGFVRNVPAAVLQAPEQAAHAPPLFGYPPSRHRATPLSCSQSLLKKLICSYPLLNNLRRVLTAFARVRASPFSFTCETHRSCKEDETRAKCARLEACLCD